MRRILFDMAKRQNSGADTTALEQDHRTRHGAGIDRLVYALYGLTPAEIKFTQNPVSALVESASIPRGGISV